VSQNRSIMEFQNPTQAVEKWLSIVNKCLQVCGYASFKFPSPTYKFSIIGALMTLVNILFFIWQSFKMYQSFENSHYLENVSTDVFMNLLMTSSFIFSLICTSIILILNLLMRKPIYDFNMRLVMFDVEVIFFK
jgi:hypothetical protein